MPAVTLSGFNNIDFSAILEAVMTQERVPFTALGTKKAQLQQQNTQLGTLAAKLTTLQNAAEKLASPDSLSVLKAATSDAGIVGVSTSSGTTSGVYDIVVDHRAKAQVTASTSTATADQIVTTGGTLQLLVGGNPPVTIVANGAMTLSQVADAINAEGQAPVNASVIQVTPGNYRLVLTSKQTGVDNAFTFTSTLAGGSGITFGGADGTYGEAADLNSVEAIDAALTVNNVPITSSSNTLDDVIPGATLTLNGENSLKTVQVTVSRDGDGMSTQVDGFVKAYNDLMSFVNEQRTSAISGNASVGRDPMVRGLHTDLRSAILGSHGAGALTNLASVGIGFDRAGLMTVDTKVFKEAVATNPGALQTLFAGEGAGATDGAFDDLSALLTRYTDSGGLLKGARTRIEDQVRNISQRMDTMDAQLSLRRSSLQAEFIAADQAMQALNSQVSALSALDNQYRLF
jgi:flagellar hook-associated protein 2